MLLWVDLCRGGRPGEAGGAQRGRLVLHPLSGGGGWGERLPLVGVLVGTLRPSLELHRLSAVGPAVLEHEQIRIARIYRDEIRILKYLRLCLSSACWLVVEFDPLCRPLTMPFFEFVREWSAVYPLR